jgi:hypothetical protein|tara:strand:+ start:6117 stop:6584 length:468 start_codon:yes stop_codon:yes gene_type:complete
MFVTYRTSEKRDISAINQSMQAWPMVELVLHKAVCLIKFEALGHGDDERIVRTLLVSDPFEFREMLSGQSKELFVHGINLLTPQEMNGGDSWKVDRLVNISSIHWHEADKKCHGFSYEVEGGMCYQDVPRAFVESTRVDEVIFHEPRDINPELFS